MKLKSKLIATIVSICAAIAVMGVGVWAATSSFTVTVTNNIELGFNNLVGSVSVLAEAEADVTGELTAADGGTAATYKTVTDKTETLYNSADETAVKYNAIAATGTGTTLAFEGADFLKTYDEKATDKTTTGYITHETKVATISYTFTFTPPTGTAGTGSIAVTATQTATLPTVTGGASINAHYYVSNDDGTTWYPLSSGVQAVAGAYSDTIMVKCFLEYANPNLVSASVDGQWLFSVQFTAVSDLWTDGTSSITNVGSAATLGALTAGKIAIS